METTNTILSIGFMNIRGQTGLNSAKQAQIQSFLLKNKLDVLNLQEIHICDDSFSDSNSISSSFNIISNNAPSKYGTASIISSDLVPESVFLDSNGRAIVFNIGPITLANLNSFILKFSEPLQSCCSVHVYLDKSCADF